MGINGDPRLAALASVFRTVFNKLNIKDYGGQEMMVCTEYASYDQCLIIAKPYFKNCLPKCRLAKIKLAKEWPAIKDELDEFYHDGLEAAKRSATTELNFAAELYSYHPQTPGKCELAREEINIRIDTMIEAHCEIAQLQILETWILQHVAFPECEE